MAEAQEKRRVSLDSNDESEELLPSPKASSSKNQFDYEQKETEQGRELQMESSRTSISKEVRFEFDDQPSMRRRPIHESLQRNAQAQHGETSSWKANGIATKKTMTQTWRGIRESTVGFDLNFPFKIIVMVLIFVILIIELIMYLLVRLIIGIVERVYKFLAIHLQTGSPLPDLDKCRNYEEWKECATKWDNALGLKRWKEKDTSPLYDHKNVRVATQRLGSHIRQVKKLVQQKDGENQRRNNKKATIKDIAMTDDTTGVISAMIETLKSTLNKNTRALGIYNEALYSETLYGTKTLIRDFHESTINVIKLVPQIDSMILSNEKKLQLFNDALNNFGRMALCLSSGASMAYYHFGVAKALHSERILPRIISGASGGAVVAAFLCSHTDEELDRMLHPEVLTPLCNACEDSWPVRLSRWWKKGVLFDKDSWYEKGVAITCGKEMTFLEAYERTGRVLNISISSRTKFGDGILLNYQTTPDVVIASAIAASSAFHGIIEPPSLRIKRSGQTKSDKFESFGESWTDGAIKLDIPSKELAEQFDVNFCIISQVSPSVIPFINEASGSVGSPVQVTLRRRGFKGGFLGYAIEVMLRYEIFKWMRVLSELDLVSSETDARHVMVHVARGDLLIYPRRGMKIFYDFLTLLQDPSRERMQEYLGVGMKSTWPKIYMLKYRYRMERLLILSRDLMQVKVDQEKISQHPLVASIDVSSSGNHYATMPLLSTEQKTNPEVDEQYNARIQRTVRKGEEPEHMIARKEQELESLLKTISSAENSRQNSPAPVIRRVTFQPEDLGVLEEEQNEKHKIK